MMHEISLADFLTRNLWKVGTSTFLAKAARRWEGDSGRWQSASLLLTHSLSQSLTPLLGCELLSLQCFLRRRRNERLLERSSHAVRRRVYIYVCECVWMALKGFLKMRKKGILSPLRSIHSSSIILQERQKTNRITYVQNFFSDTSCNTV